jgi:hypothetical protein
MGLVDPPGFRRNRLGQVWMHLTDQERDLMGDLLAQLAGMLAEQEPQAPTDPLAELVGIDPAAERPSDPVMARLFPDAYEEPELADEFRRFTQRELQRAKRDRISRAARTLARPDPTELDQEECLAWLGALNDLRLVLGTRLDITEEDQSSFRELPEDDPVRATYFVYDWLTYHQDRLIRALDQG